MKRYLLAVLAVAGLAVAVLFLPGTGPVAAKSQKPTAVFDSQGRLELPTGFRRWAFLGAPLTPNGLNGGNASFPEFHNVYVEEKNLDDYLKTGSFPEGTVLIK